MYCLTSPEFGGSFERIVRYMMRATRQWLVIEFVRPDDRAIKAFHHIDRCGNASLSQ